MCERGRKKERWRKGEREGGGRERERGMRGVCACVRVYVCMCEEGGREGEKEGGRRERGRGVTGVCMCVYMCPCMCVHVCGV